MGPLRAWIGIHMLKRILVPLALSVAIISTSGRLVEMSSLASKETKEKVLDDSIQAVELCNMRNTALSSILLPPEMDLWRRGISLDTVYGAPPQRVFGEGGECSCRNTTATQECCERTIRVSHKMGFVMTKALLRVYQKPQPLLSAKGPGKPGDWIFERMREVDYRDVLLFRDIYTALKSGYLYHLTGRECWLDPDGRPLGSNYTKAFVLSRQWFNVVALKVPESLHRKRTLCQFLQEEDEKLGMRIYIDFVFNFDYKRSFALWALARAFPEVRERTRHACYEDFLSPTKDKQAIESALSFVFNRSIEWEGNLPGHTAYSGPHASSHKADPNQSRRLLQIIRELDEEVFNNEIAWVDSVLPC